MEAQPDGVEAAPRPAPVPAPVGGLLTPVIPEGRSALPDSLYAERVGSVVTVHFDRPLTRTRRSAKFEQIVRATLPAVYGAAADSMLAATPVGAIGAAGDLLAELPLHGVRLPLRTGGSLVLRPETRPGRDGPLVVSYRAVVTP